MNLKEDLIKILKEDPLNILKSKRASIPKPDDRFIESFNEINQFYETNNRLPIKENNLLERKLSLRLDAINNDDSLILKLKKYDKYNLLHLIKSPNTIEDIIKSDHLGIFDEESDLFNISNLKKRGKPEEVVKRKKCNDFEKYEHLFLDIHQKLANGELKQISFNDRGFKEGESHLKPNSFFVLKGMLMYLKSFDDLGARKFYDNTNGDRLRIDGRITCIFENGTMSNMLLRSLQKQLYDNGKTIVQNENKNQNILSDSDKFSGYIYVLKSKSKDLKISSIQNLHKIGFSKNQVSERIKNAQNDPTYLMSDVEIISTYKCYNFDPFKFEQIIHSLFISRRLNIQITDKNNQVKKPKEWYQVPLSTIDKAINLILTNQIKYYKFDINTQSLILS